MKLFTILTVLIFGTVAHSAAQSYAFGPKGGLTLGVQKWDGYDQNPLLAYHGVAFIESAPEDNQFALFAQAGFHQKGSTQGGGTFTSVLNGQPVDIPVRKFIFENVSLVIGAKRKFDLGGGGSKYYYMLGIRGEYTVNTNLEEYEEVNDFFQTLYYPTDAFVRKFNYGVTAGGGLEFPFSEFIKGVVELTISPDFSKQYEQPPLNNVYDPYRQQNVNLPGRVIRNIAFELSVGVRFLRKIEYID